MADGLLNKASIILTPTGYKAGTLYNVAPIDEPYEDFDFARTSTATRINSSGLVSNVATGVPRISYDSNGDNGHILLEPTSTNLFGYSEDIDSNSFSKVGSSIESNVTTSPDGTLNADLLKENNESSPHFIYKDMSVTSGQDYTISVFAKSNGVNRDLRLNSTSVGWSSGFNVNFDLSEGTATSGGIIESYGNDWYRCSVTGTTNATTARLIIYCTLNGTTSYSGDNVSGLFLWGMQLEQLPYATSYIPTLTGSTVTRATETANGAGSADLINSTEGVLYAEIAALANDGELRMLNINDGTKNNRVGLQYSSTTNSITAAYDISGAGQVPTLSHTLSNALDFNKIAFKYKQNDFALWINGVEVGTDTSGNVLPSNTLNNIESQYGDGRFYFYGKVKALAVFNEALSDDELHNLTG